jgi:ABC-2 type transport system ATP-binding protein
MDEAERCHRVGLMYEGRLIACDTPQAIRRMTPGELLEVRPPDVYAAQAALRGLEGVLETQTYGDVLHVFVDKAEKRSAQILELFRTQGIELTGLRRIEPRMEEAFVSIIRHQTQDVRRAGDVA